MDCKMMSTVVASLFAGVAVSMPTQRELAKERPVVAELMSSAVADHKANRMTAEQVAETAMGFAESAESDAAKYLLFSGAVSYYIRGGAYGKAADVATQMQEKIADVPPSKVSAVILNAFGSESAAKKSPKLYSYVRLAKAQMKAAADRKKLEIELAKVSYDALRRQYAEALALCGDWKAALSEFSKITGNVGKTAKAELNGTSSNLSLGDFWWNYIAIYEDGEGVFKERAANYYRKAIADGKVDGLKKSLVEQRLASLTLPDKDTAMVGSRDPRTVSPKQPLTVSGANATRSTTAGKRISHERAASSAKTPAGLVHRWTFDSDFSDSVGKIAPSKSDNATIQNGAVTLRPGSPVEFPAGTVPAAPFTVQVWASATDKGLSPEGNDFIFKVASDGKKNENAFWRWTANKKWFSRIGAFGAEKNCYQKNGYLLEGRKNLYTLTAEKDGKGLILKFYRDDTCYGTIKTEFAFKKPLSLTLGGWIAPTYDEVRVYSRALPHQEIVEIANNWPDKAGKGK